MLDRRRTFACAGVVTRRQVHGQQPLTNLVILRTENGRFAQSLDRFCLPPPAGKLRGQRFEIADSARGVLDQDARARAVESRRVVGGIERTQSDSDLGKAALVSAGSTALAERLQERSRVEQQALTRGDLSGLEQCVLVVRLDLQDLLVERDRLRKKSILVQAVGDAGELIDRLVDLSGADVQIAEDVGGIPVARLILDDEEILRDRRIRLSLPEQLLGVAQLGSAVDGHSSVSQSYQTALRGRNERRCASE